MAINKVIYGNNTLIDLTSDTAQEQDVASGKTFHKNDGTQAIGTASSGNVYTLLASDEIEVSTTSTSATKVKDIPVADIDSLMSKNKMIYIRVRDKAGRRNGYFYSSEVFLQNFYNSDHEAYSSWLYNGLRSIYSVNTSGIIEQQNSANSGGYGVYCYGIYKDGYVRIYSQYNSTRSKTIDGTYIVEVYAVNYPGGRNPFGA